MHNAASTPFEHTEEVVALEDMLRCYNIRNIRDATLSDAGDKGQLRLARQPQRIQKAYHKHVDPPTGHRTTALG
jgi:hypothetical protein